MNKKVRYAAGALGALPALGLLAPPATAAAATTAHAAKKTVRNAVVHQRGAAPADDCVGSIKSKITTSGVTLTFWWASEGASHKCIGTIEVSGHFGDAPERTWDYVKTVNGKHFCAASTPSSKLVFVCREIFTTDGLAVFGSQSWTNPAPYHGPAAVNGRRAVKFDF